MRQARIGWSVLVPRYFFAIQWSDHEHDDNDGTSLRNDAAAVKHAYRIIRELKEAGGYDDPELKMIIKNEAGTVIHTIPF